MADRRILINNRDEFLSRPTAYADVWKPHPDSEVEVIAPLDLEVAPKDDTPNYAPVFVPKVLTEKSGGTWVGFNPVTGRWATVLSIRENLDMPGAISHPPPKNPTSRGHLVNEFLKMSWPSMSFDFERHLIESYFSRVDTHHALFRGFNLILGNAKYGISAYYTNRLNEGQEPKVTETMPKFFDPKADPVHGISNSDYFHPWPKVNNGKQLFQEALKQYTDRDSLSKALFDILNREEPSPNKEHYTIDRIRMPVGDIPGKQNSPYGTRTSTVLLVDKNDKVTYYERTLSRLDENGKVEQDPNGVENRIFESKLAAEVGSTKRLQ